MDNILYRKSVHHILFLKFFWNARNYVLALAIILAQHKSWEPCHAIVYSWIPHVKRLLNHGNLINLCVRRGKKPASLWEKKLGALRSSPFRLPLIFFRTWQIKRHRPRVKGWQRSNTKSAARTHPVPSDPSSPFH